MDKKNTFFTTFRGDIREVATIARWLQSQGITPRSRNELIQVAVENFAKQLVKLFPETAIIDSHDALTFLTELGLIGANRKKIVSSIADELWEASELTTGTTISNSSELTTKAKKKSNETTALEAVELMKKLEQRTTQDNQRNEEFVTGGHAPIASENEEN